MGMEKNCQIYRTSRSRHVGRLGGDIFFFFPKKVKVLDSPVDFSGRISKENKLLQLLMAYWHHEGL